MGADEARLSHFTRRVLSITFSDDPSVFAQRVFDAMFAWFGTEAPMGCSRVQHPRAHNHVEKAPLRRFYDEFTEAIRPKIGRWMNDRRREDRAVHERGKAATADRQEHTAAKTDTEGKSDERGTVAGGAPLH